jgi:small subunit ribosomal protein S6
MNIECDQVTLTELESGFRFNDAILRSMTLLKKEAITGASAIALSGNDGQKAPSRVKEDVEEESDAIAAVDADVEEEVISE